MNVAILGYGTEGKSLAAHFKKKGATITVFDQSPATKIPKTFRAIVGPDAFKKVTGFDVVFKSPGILPTHVKHIKNLTTLTEYFFEHCPCPIIGVTGTKGKGTTSTLIHAILKEAGYDAHLGGNIGIPPLDFLNRLKQGSIVVLELSSFQTQDLKRSPHIAVILNTTSDHMDYHRDRAEYHAAKAQLLAHQKSDDFVVTNADYPAARRIARHSKGKLLTVSTRKPVKRGAEIQGENIVLKTPEDAQIILPIQEVGLRGPHNLENILPAVVVASLLDVSPQTIHSAVKAFKGLPHRLEHVATVKKVDYFNDSFSTTPETSVAAIRSFTQPVHLIAGGSEKNSSFTAWAKACAQQPNLKTVLLTGNQSARRMEKALRAVGDLPFKLLRVATLEEAVQAARERARAGDVIVLSPACASFEEFPNYKKRGETFRDLAAKS